MKENIGVCHKITAEVNHNVRDGYEEKDLASVMLGEIFLLRKTNKQQIKRSEMTECLSWG